MQVHAWRILRKLGEGGYGYVYLVEFPDVEGEPFTLKLSKFRQGEGGARADKERALLSRVGHPNIVQVFGHGHWPHPARGWPYLILEYVEGPSLWQWLERHNPTPRDVTLMVAALADALATVHERGALHRDVKGENILVRASDGQPVLLDFGVGDYEDSETVTLAVLPPGTAHYRSPESLRFLREHRDTKARYEFRPVDDLYALGVVFFRLLADEFPFSPSLPPDLLYADIEGRAPPPPAALNPRVPTPLSALVLKLLAKHPEERPLSVRALHEELLAVLRVEDPAWDLPLFEWEEARTPHALTTEEEPRAEVSSKSPGETHRVRRRRVMPPLALPGASLERALLPRPPRSVEAPRSRPSTSVSPEVAGELRLHHRLVTAGALLAVALLLFVAARGGLGGNATVASPLLAVATSPTPLSPEPEGPPPDSAEPPPRPQGSAPAMNPQKPHAPSTPAKRTSNLVGSCLALAATASMTAACAGAPLKPRTNQCPPEAVQAMKKHGIRLYSAFELYWDASTYEQIEKALKSSYFRKAEHYKVYSDGPVVGRVKDPRETGVPEGTLLYGYVWVDADPDYAVVRVHEALLPNGRKIPICVHTTQQSSGRLFANGSWKHDNSKPQAAIMFPLEGGVFVDRYPEEISGGVPSGF